MKNKQHDKSNKKQIGRIGFQHLVRPAYMNLGNEKQEGVRESRVFQTPPAACRLYHNSNKCYHCLMPVYIDISSQNFYPAKNFKKYTRFLSSPGISKKESFFMVNKIIDGNQYPKRKNPNLKGQFLKRQFLKGYGQFLKRQFLKGYGQFLKRYFSC